MEMRAGVINWNTFNCLLGRSSKCRIKSKSFLFWDKPLI